MMISVQYRDGNLSRIEVHANNGSGTEVPVYANGFSQGGGTPAFVTLDIGGTFTGDVALFLSPEQARKAAQELLRAADIASPKLEAVA